MVKRKWVLVLCMRLVLLVIGSTISHATLEGDALSVIQEQLHADTNWTGNDPCKAWDGVKCYNNNVVELNLSGRALYGTIPKEIGVLSSLKVLDLSDNAINGSIPDTISNLSNLQSLILDNSKLSGPLPSGIQQLSMLETLYVGNSSFTGPIPPLGKLVNLKQLTMWGNNLNSTIPVDIGELKNLEYLNFHDCNMYGTLPAEVGNLHKLRNISLHNNLFTGTIPDSWISLVNLEHLSLYGNRLTGSFPNWIFALNATINLRCNYFVGPKPTNLDEYYYTGNCLDSDLDSHMRFCVNTPNCVFFYSQPENGQSGYSPKEKRKNTGVIIGVSTSSVLILAIVLVIVYAWKNKKHKKNREMLLRTPSTDPADSEIVELFEPPSGIRRFALKDILKVTEGFSKTYEIGCGGFGKVYKAYLDDGSMVAIKRASASNIQRHKQFQNEIVLLSRLCHRCLVKLQGFCHEADEQVLVYEFMKNGNLENLLFEDHAKESLSWYKRIEISVAIAQGLDYLHTFVDPPIIHRDVKPSNILLDEHFNAKLSDFGISKSTPDFIDTHVSTAPAGTFGYLDPQYFMRRQLTPSSDVYSFGVLLLVLVSGQKAIDHTRSDEFNLVEWINIKLQEGDIKLIVDPNLHEDYNIEDVGIVIELALKCAAFERFGRPSMKEVLSILEPLLKKKVVSPSIGFHISDNVSARSFPTSIDHCSSDKHQKVQEPIQTTHRSLSNHL